MKVTPLDNPATATPISVSRSPVGSPFLVGLRAARANVVPGLCVQTFVLAIIYTYYRLPQFHPWFDRLGEFKQNGGYGFIVGSSLVAGALMPAVFTLACLERRLPVWRDVGNFFFSGTFYGINAVVVDGLYRWQNVWFGTAGTVSTVVKKILVDQMIYSPLFAAPFAVLCFAWKNQGYALLMPERIFTPRNYLRRVVPTLFATWAVWIPVVAMLYCLPPLLQIPIYSLVICFWALMLAYIHAKPKPVA